MNDDSTLFQRLAWRVAERLAPAGHGRAVLVTSARHGEGRSYVAAALARALSDQTAGAIGLVDCTSSDVPALHDLVAALAEAKSSGQGRVVRSGLGGGDVTMLFRSARVMETVELLRRYLQYVIIDGPLLADSGVLSACTDGTLLVIDASRTRREIVRGSLQANPSVKQRMLGAVLNQAPRYVPGWLYQRSL